ncbi:MAG: diaminopimelate epimerase [Candidatus Omnitrophica bacterium]|nr:diaminopimelate epimerase [Candidatus Omnitrophota bacterium]
MRKINFNKMVASGNDFIVVDQDESKAIFCKRRVQSLANALCDRKYGIGADGLLLLEKSKKADIRMRIFNADGTEANMCGNGARCAALYSSLDSRNKFINIETKAGIIESRVQKNSVKIKLTDPKYFKLDIPLRINGMPLRVNFVDTGVPHAVIFVSGIDRIDVNGIGRIVRFHNKFAPAGANVNFVEVLGGKLIRVRTYERGVEAETLACGTGSVASALILAAKHLGVDLNNVNVMTQGKELLKVYFDKFNGIFKNVWLEGKAGVVYKGEYYV